MKKITARWINDGLGYNDKAIEPSIREIIKSFRQSPDSLVIEVNQDLVLTCFRLMIKIGLLLPEEFVFEMDGKNYTVHPSGRWFNVTPPTPDVHMNFLMELLGT